MIQDLVSDNLDHLKRLRRSNRVDEHVAMNPNEMLGVQDAVFILGKKSSQSHALFPLKKLLSPNKKEINIPDQPYRQSRSHTPAPYT